MKSRLLHWFEAGKTSPLSDHITSPITTPLRLILATTAALWVGSASAQSPPVVRPGIELRFKDFFRNPIGPRGPELSQALEQAQGKVVRLVGYMVQQESPTPGRFMLAPRPVQMSEAADGDADDLPAATATVYLDASQKDQLVSHVPGLIEVHGVLELGRLEESDLRVSWVRVLLPAQAAQTVRRAETMGAPQTAPKH